MSLALNITLPTRLPLRESVVSFAIAGSSSSRSNVLLLFQAIMFWSPVLINLMDSFLAFKNANGTFISVRMESDSLVKEVVSVGRIAFKVVGPNLVGYREGNV